MLTFKDLHSELVHPDDMLSPTPMIVPLNLWFDKYLVKRFSVFSSFKGKKIDQVSNTDTFFLKLLHPQISF